MIEQAVRQLIAADATVADAVGERVRPNALRPGDAYPGIAYESGESVDPSPLLDGTPSGTWETPLTLTVVAETYEEAQRLARELARVLNAAVNVAAPNGCEVAYIRTAPGSDDEEDREGDDPLYLRSVVAQAVYTIPTP